MRIVRAAFIAACLTPVCVVAAQQNDLREFRIGMPVSALPDKGYGAFTCTADPSKMLMNWSDFRSCPAAPDGTRAVSFRYANDGASEDGDGSKTQVAGQPVNLALLIDNNAQIAGLKIETNPNVRLYLHKKAYLFGLQVRARYGEDGWTCEKAAPTPSEQPVGGVFIHEHCEKVTASRHFVLDRALFRDPAKDLRDLTDATRLTILRAG